MQGIGLLGLLLVAAIIFYVMFAAGGNGSVGTAQHVQQTVKPQVEQMSGKDADGKPASESVVIEATPKGAAVTSVAPDGAFEKFFGLKAGDVIVEIGPLAKDQFQDTSTAKAYLLSEYERSGTLLVQRGSQRIKLPDQRAESGTPSVDGATPPPVQRTTPRGQLDSILKGRQDNGVPTH